MAARGSRPKALAPIVRPRLLRTLARPWKVAVLCAPAGYGKTTLAVQFARGRRALWTRLAREDRDPGHLLGTLLAATDRSRGSLGARTRSWFRSRRDMERDGALLLGSLVAELGRGPWLIVIDDVHAIANARGALRWLQRLIEDTGPETRFMLVGRGECPLPVARLNLVGGVCTVGSGELRFTPAEQAQLLRRAGVARSRVTAEILEEIEGWPAGLVLLARHLRAGTALPGDRRSPLGARGAEAGEDTPGGAIALLAEQVYAPLPAALKRSLCHAALLDELDPGALRALLGPAAADRLRNEVEKRDLFLDQLPGETAPRFHPLFRRFLRTRCWASTKPAERRRMAERVARHWEGRGETTQAIRVLAQGGALEAAARLFERTSRRPAGPQTGALRPVALDIVLGAPGLGILAPAVLLHGAHEARDAERLEEALRLARESQDGFLRRRAYGTVTRAFALEAELAQARGSLRESRRRGEALIRAIPARHATARGNLARQVGLLHLYGGDRARARKRLADAVRWLEKQRPVDRAAATVSLGTISFMEGRWDVYLSLAQQALPVFRRAGYRERAGNLLVNMAEACTYLGLEHLALAHLDEAGSLLPRRGGMPDPLVQTCRARARSERGDWAEAAREFATARDAVLRYGSGLQMAQLDVWAGVCARRRGRLEEAERCLSRAGVAFAAVEVPGWRPVARMERALVRGLRGHAAEALRELAATEREIRSSGDRKELARNILFQARVRLAAGLSPDGPLARALDQLIRLDYLVLLRKESDLAVPLLAHALANPALGSRARRCLPALPEPDRRRLERQLARSAALHPTPRGRGGEGAGARDVRTGPRPGIPSVRVRLLGALEVMVNERPVRFPRRAAAALVGLLALRRGEAVRREALAETLWPHASFAASRNRFDVTLNAARHALEPGAHARGPFRLLTADEGMCRLAAPGPFTDVERFEATARECTSLLPPASELETALEGQPRPPVVKAMPRIAFAMESYRGDLAEELPQTPWVEAERQRLRELHHRLRTSYALLALADGQLVEAADAARRVLDEDPFHERALRAWMRARAALGDRAGALRACQTFEQKLAVELDTAPSPETLALRRQLAERGT